MRHYAYAHTRDLGRSTSWGGEDGDDGQRPIGDSVHRSSPTFLDATEEFHLTRSHLRTFGDDEEDDAE